VPVIGTPQGHFFVACQLALAQSSAIHYILSQDS
jgi:hypothetical protein